MSNGKVSSIVLLLTVTIIYVSARYAQLITHHNADHLLLIYPGSRKNKSKLPLTSICVFCSAPVPLLVARLFPSGFVSILQHGYGKCIDTDGDFKQVEHDIYNAVIYFYGLNEHNDHEDWESHP